MRVKVEFEDKSAFTAEEAEKAYKLSFGKDAQVEILPHNNTPEAHLYFALQSMITLDQLENFYEYFPHGYPDKLDVLKKQTLSKVSQILDQVIQDNESRIME